MKETRALVLLSGGLDSAVALYWALDKGYAVETLTFDYYLRSKKEIIAAKRLSKLLGCANRSVSLTFLKEIEDSRMSNRNRKLVDVPSAYIPNRNVIFYGIAASFAEMSDCKYIVGGHNKNDKASFPDSSEEFFRQFNLATSIGLYTGRSTGRVVLPFSKLEKSQVILLGHELKVPFELTWSCYTQQRHPCGKCHSCTLRAQGFKGAGLKDPLIEKTKPTVRS